MALPTRKILGTSIAVTDYDSALAEVLTLLETNRPAAISASNTHLVSLARHDPSFRRVLSGFSINLPDGIPLIWNLNAQGAKLVVRVYGPYFMRHVLQNAPSSTRHFFFGGSQRCLDAMEEQLRSLRPDIQIAGTISPPYRAWSDEEEEDFAKVIHDSKADFVWVALGGGRQERWIAKNLSRHDRGIFVAVGDAFELLAGTRPFAPDWMQRTGLTWLYRLCQEPRRYRDHNLRGSWQSR